MIERTGFFRHQTQYSLYNAIIVVWCSFPILSDGLYRLSCAICADANDGHSVRSDPKLFCTRSRRLKGGKFSKKGLTTDIIYSFPSGET
jgi:hypothetical protein